MIESSSVCITDRRKGQIRTQMRCLAPSTNTKDDLTRLAERVRAVEQMLSESGLRPLPSFSETELANLCAG
jgi:hypothetical protein